MELSKELTVEQQEKIQKLLDAEWLVVNGIREVLGIARTGQQATYQETLSFAKTLSPKWFNPESSLLVKDKESKSARYYRDRAKLSSKKEGREINPADLIKDEIKYHEELLKISEIGDDKSIRKKLDSLTKILREFEPNLYSEDQVIRRDVYTASYKLPLSENGKDYRQFILPRNRILRVRMLHPNKPEHITGADVIYEHYSDYEPSLKLFNSVRMAAVQYKIWDKKALYFKEREINQIQRLKSTFCMKGLCEDDSDRDRIGLGSFRLPSCSAFLRPTDRLQSSDSSLITSGLHIRICALEELWENSGEKSKKLSLGNLEKYRNESLSSETFQDLFRNELLGSRNITIEQLNELYREFEILQPEDRVIIHAQDFEA